MSCKAWPSNLNFSNSLQSNGSESDRVEFCKNLDAYVLESFKSQTFMRGFSPRAVEKSLAESNKKNLLDVFMKDWIFDRESCGNCEDIGTFYERNVKPKKEWRSWLLDFSASTHYSDAILVPFLSFAREDKENDRGLLISKRSMGVSLLLIDTQNANVIWNSSRQSLLSKQDLSTNGSNFPEFPKWSDVSQALMIDSLWREYPGRVFL